MSRLRPHHSSRCLVEHETDGALQRAGNSTLRGRNRWLQSRRWPGRLVLVFAVWCWGLADASAQPEVDCPPGFYCEPTLPGPARPAPSPTTLPIEERTAAAPPPVPRAFPRFEALARVGFAPLDSGAERGAGLWGVGGALRAWSLRTLAWEGATYFVTGKDYLGRSRSEWLLDGSVVLQSRSRGPRPYLGLGPHVALAWVDAGATTHAFAYVGGQLVFGLSVPFSRRFSLAAEVGAVLRTRVDGSTPPEFVDPETARTTNTSAALIPRLAALYAF